MESGEWCFDIPWVLPVIALDGSLTKLHEAAADGGTGLVWQVKGRARVLLEPAITKLREAAVDGWTRSAQQVKGDAETLLELAIADYD